MSVTRRRAEPPAAPGAAVTDGSGPPVPEPAPDLGDVPTPHFLLDAESADLLLLAALRDLATKVVRHRWVGLVPRPSEPEAEIERLH